MARQFLSRAPLWPLITLRSADAPQTARATAMRRFGQSTAPQRAPQTIASVPRPAPLSLPSTIALDSFFVQHAPLNDASLASTPRLQPGKALMTNPGAAPQKLSGNKDMYMDQLASIFGGFVPFRTPAPPGFQTRQQQPKWQRMVLSGGVQNTQIGLLESSEAKVARSLLQDAEANVEEAQMAREVIQAARLWVNIKKIRHQKIKKHKLAKLRKRDRILRKQK